MTALGSRGPILLMGDSITFSWGELSVQPGVVNRAYPGETTGQMMGRLDHELQTSGADGLHLMSGINDIAGNAGPVPLPTIQHNLLSMCAMARQRGCRVWLASVLPVDDIFWNSEVRDASDQVKRLNLSLRAQATGAGVVYLDYHRLLAAADGRLRPEFGTDGVHLSTAGYAAITPCALEAFAGDLDHGGGRLQRALSRIRAGLCLR